MIINTETKLFAILGHPIKQSLSPQIQNEWFKKEGLNCVYLAFDQDCDHLDEAVKAIKLFDFCGVNITVPYKIEIIKYVDFLDDIAMKIGSVNTLNFVNGKIHAYNTDYLGFTYDLLAKKVDLENKNVLVIGAGGSARAVIYSLKNKRVKKIYVANRTIKNANRLANIFELDVVNISNIDSIISDIDLLVNTSSCGLNDGDTLPFDSAIDVKDNLIVYDLIFNKSTPFVKFAKLKKLRIFTGEGMLIYQGAFGFKIWTGKYPDITIAENILKKFVK
ncbi:MAG: shikimate dehydrogenase [Endomicrobium sp.]|nr:shikimate dehydrogenase [Endomicrobium sp.]